MRAVDKWLQKILHSPSATHRFPWHVLVKNIVAEVTGSERHVAGDEAVAEASDSFGVAGSHGHGAGVVSGASIAKLGECFARVIE